MANGAFEPVDLSYDDISWFRKRWFAVVTLLLFSPAIIYICLTGDVFAKRKDGVYKYSTRQRYSLVAVAILFLVQGVVRAIW